MGRALRAPNNIVRAKTLREAKKIVCLVPPGTHRTKVITEKSELPPIWRNDPWIIAAKRVVALRFHVNPMAGRTSVYGTW